MTAYEDAVNALEAAGTDRKQAVTVANVVVDALDKAGWLTTDNDHLAMLRATLRVIHAATMNPETPPRELSPLTRRLQDLSGEVTTLEERQNKERGPKRGRTRNNSTGGSGAFDPSSI